MIEKQITVEQLIRGLTYNLKYSVKDFGTVERMTCSKGKTRIYNRRGESMTFVNTDLMLQKITILKKSQDSIE